MLLCLLIQYCCLSERLVRRFYKICFVEFASLTLIFVWKVTSLKFMLYCQNFDICRMHFLKVVFCKAFSRSFQVSRSFLLLIQNLATTFRHQYYFWISTQFVPHVLVALRLWISRCHLMFSPAAKKFLQKALFDLQQIKESKFSVSLQLDSRKTFIIYHPFLLQTAVFFKISFPHRLSSVRLN